MDTWILGAVGGLVMAVVTCAIAYWPGNRQPRWAYAPDFVAAFAACCLVLWVAVLGTYAYELVTRRKPA